MKIEKNSFVTINYLIRLGDRETYPPNGQPEEISFCMGLNSMPPGLEGALLGMEPEEQKVVHLAAREAYGDLDQELIMEVPRTDFPPEVELRPGLVFETQNEEGHYVYFVVKEINPDKVIIDFNHPLAGRDLEVSFTVRQVREATEEDLKEHHACTCPQCAEGEPHRH